MRRELLVCFLLVAAVAAVYWPVHSYPFVLLDDYSYVVDNPYVHKGLTRDGLVHACTGITVGNWHPVTMLSHILDCQLFGAEEQAAGWHHLVNLALHAANTVLLFIALRWMTGACWRSALVAALFGLHPLHVESVAWISERKDVLSTLFFMLTLLAYYHYVQRPTPLRYVTVFLALALGLMSKPMLVTAPLVLLLLDYWPLNRMRVRRIKPAPDEPPVAGDTEAEEAVDDNQESEGTAEQDEGEEEGEAVSAGETGAADAADIDSEQTEPSQADESGKLSLAHLIVEKIPLFVLAAASAVTTCIVQQLSGAMGMLGQQVPLWRRLGNALFSYGQYLEESFWPSPLAAIYPYANRKAIDVLIVGLALGAISVAAVRLARLRPFLLVGWCWYLGTLVPVIGIVQVGVQALADRYTYIPLIGIFIIVAWGAAEFAADWPARNKAVVAALVLTACGWCAWRQVATWSSSEALYKNAVETQRFNPLAQYGLGMVYWQEGKLDEAQQQFAAVLKLQSDPHLHGGLEPFHRAMGLLLAVRRQPQEALKQLDAAIGDRPQQPEPYRHKAWILATSREDHVRNGKKAVKCAEQALELSPRKQPEYWDTLAAAQAEAGNFPAAVAVAEKALQQARLMHADDLIPGIQRRLDLFQLGLPYHAETEFPQRM